jgi:hypothetical protein
MRPSAPETPSKEKIPLFQTFAVAWIEAGVGELVA